MNKPTFFNTHTKAPHEDNIDWPVTNEHRGEHGELQANSEPPTAIEHHSTLEDTKTFLDRVYESGKTTTTTRAQEWTVERLMGYKVCEADAQELADAIKADIEQLRSQLAAAQSALREIQRLGAVDQGAIVAR